MANSFKPITPNSFLANSSIYSFDMCRTKVNLRWSPEVCHGLICFNQVVAFCLVNMYILFVERQQDTVDECPAIVRLNLVYIVDREFFASLWSDSTKTKCLVLCDHLLPSQTLKEEACLYHVLVDRCCSTGPSLADLECDSQLLQ